MSFSGMVFLILLGLIIFGPEKLSYVGKIGREIAELKSLSSDFKSQLEIEMDGASKQKQKKKIAPASSSQNQLPTDTGLRVLETDGCGREHERVEAFHG
jgi:Sec-independent protein translocase protein TatA